MGEKIAADAVASYGGQIYQRNRGTIKRPLGGMVVGLGIPHLICTSLSATRLHLKPVVYHRIDSYLRASYWLNLIPKTPERGALDDLKAQLSFLKHTVPLVRHLIRPLPTQAFHSRTSGPVQGRIKSPQTSNHSTRKSQTPSRPHRQITSIPGGFPT